MIIKNKSIKIKLGASLLILIIIPIFFLPLVLIILKQWIASLFIFLFFYLLNLIALFFTYKNKRNNIQAKITWLIVQLFFPGVGAYIYYVFGRIPRRVKNNLNKSFLLENELMPKNIQHSNIKLIDNGSNKFKKLWNSLENAKEYINIQYFIINPGIIEKKLFSILKRKALEGVKIRILYDYLGVINLKQEEINDWKKHNIEVVEFRPIKWLNPNGSDNWRTHNKIIVIDGLEVYFGGNNIGDEYASLSGKYGDWIDSHYLARGDIVNAYNVVFITQWFIQTNENISHEFKVKKNNIKNKLEEIKFLIDSPDREIPIFFKKFIDEINSSKKSIKIISPYFAFPFTFKLAIKNAIKRGVNVEILTSGKADKAIAYYQSSFDIETLNKLGAKTYRLVNLFLHTKMYIIDEEKVIFGTSNLDYRSFFHHFETNIFLKDKDNINTFINYFNKYKSISVEDNSSRDNWNIFRSIIYFVLRLFKGLF